MLTLMRPYSYRTCRALQIMSEQHSEQHRCVGVSGAAVFDSGTEVRVAIRIELGQHEHQLHKFHLSQSVTGTAFL